jgi:N4-bis(aminopropyl)spermidine synthase
LAEAGRIVRDVAAAVGLAEGEPGVRAVLGALARLEPVSTRRLSRAVELPVPLVAAVCGELRKRSVVSEQRPARLTGLGRALYSSGALSIARPTCTTCRSRGIVIDRELDGLVADLARAAADAPAVRLELDQCHCTVETKLRRVLAMHEADAIVGRRVLLLGDDDMTSVAIHGLVRRFGSASTIASLTIVDVDPGVVEFARRALARAPFPVSTLRPDLREPLPSHLMDAFDTVAMDPPYTVAAARLFLSRAAAALAAPDGDVFLSFGSRRPGAAAAVQRAMAEMGFVIRRLVPDFNEYVGAGVLGGSSHLYHLVSTSELSPAVPDRFAGPLYTADTDFAQTASRPT